MPPLSGEVLLHGEQPLSALKRKEIARHIAMVPQNGGVYHYQTVFQFAIQGRSPHLSLLGFETTRDEEIALEALEMTQLTPYLDSRVSEISGGEKQRLAACTSASPADGDTAPGRIHCKSGYQLPG